MLDERPASPASPALGTAPRYFSKYGGNWIDAADFQDQLAMRSGAGTLTERECEQLRFFEQYGFVILPGAVDRSVVAEICRFSKAVLDSGDPRVLVEALNPGVTFPRASRQQLEPRLRERVVKMLDLYYFSDAFHEALFAPAIARFLKTLFEEPAYLFQSLSFTRGSEQPIHQDSAYVVTDQPMRMVASWIALEDIEEGSGELHYYPGSHRLPEFDFGGGKKHYDVTTDGTDIHHSFLRYLHEESRRRGFTLEKFRPKAGDCLIWHADLAHGGSPIERQGSTRNSLVAHYCPYSARPNYFTFKDGVRIETREAGESYYSSGYYP